MDPTDLRAELAERLANSTAIDAETFNAVCFLLTRALDGLELSVPEAGPLVRRLGRVAGRVRVDPGMPQSFAGSRAPPQRVAPGWVDDGRRGAADDARP